MNQSPVSRKSAPFTLKRDPLRLGNGDARNLLLERYGLLTSPRRTPTRAELLQIITDLGFVQIDSIRTIERAHHMILSTRADGYRQQDLWRLAEKDRLLFENWTHDAALLPMASFPYWVPRFRRCRQALLARWRDWRQAGFEERFEAVKRHITKNGAVKARDLAPQTKRGGAGWWDWHPDKSALEFLWRTGELAVTRRDSFQKVYDLVENVIPDHLHRNAADEEEMIDWACESALQRLGYGKAGDIAGFWDSVSVSEVHFWLERQPKGRVVPVLVDGAKDCPERKAFALADHIEGQIHSAANANPPARLRILNPFDPLIRDRKRLAHVFGFDYRIEVFVPEAKRIYGYYVCPILEGNRIVGRIDMRHKREMGGLVVRKVWWEPGVRRSKARSAKLERELERLRHFCGAEQLIAGNALTTS